MASSLEKRVQRLEGSTGAPGGLGVWASAEWAEWDLIQDSTAVLQHCSMDQFIVGRASWVAWDGAQRLLDDVRFWRGYQEPDWYASPVYLSKPGSLAWVEKQRSQYPPSDALESFSSFARWACQGEGQLRNHFAIASGIWLVDTLGLSPQQVTANGLEHARAWRFGFNELARVVGPQVMVTESPTIPLEGFPAGDWVDRSTADAPVPVLDMLLACPSGIRAAHGRIYPSVG